MSQATLIMDLPNPQLLGRDGAFDRLKNYLSQVCASALNSLPNTDLKPQEMRECERLVLFD
jgi:hypothetical protein